MNTISKNIVPYSQHYLCSFELFGDYKLGVVFQIMFDKYLYNCRTNQISEDVYILPRVLESTIAMGHKTVSKILKKLEEMHLISTVEEKLYTVNASYFYNVISLYCYAKTTVKPQIKAAFLNYDMNTLLKIGLKNDNIKLGEIARLSCGSMMQAVSDEMGQTTRVPGQTTHLTGQMTTYEGQMTRTPGQMTTYEGQTSIGISEFVPEGFHNEFPAGQMTHQAGQMTHDTGSNDPLLNKEKKGNKEKKENTGEALKRDNDDNLERGASSHEFFENSSGTGDDELPAYTTREELIQQKQKRQQQDEEILFRTYISNRHPEKYDRLPAYQIREIIAKPEYHTSDWEQIVYTLWSEYGNDKETLSCEPEITGKDLMRLVNSVKDDMELGGQSFTLSLEQVFDILAFDVIDDRNRTTFQLDFSKIRDITTPMPETGDDGDEEPSRERKPKRSRFEERRRIADYLDSITETADEDVDSLTAAEYAILQMIDYVEARKQNRETNPDEVTRYIMNSLTKKWAEAADLSEEEISRLFRTIPKRGNIVTLHPERIPVDRILQMNESRKEHSRVAELWEKKQAESRPEESVD